MPTVEFFHSDLNRLLGRELSGGELEDVIHFAKGEVDSRDGDLVKVDIKDTNRPDLWSVEGIVRELKGHYGLEKGLPSYDVGSSGVKLLVDRKVEGVRPKTVAAVVKGLSFDDVSIRQTIQLQEKITQTYGRNRSLVAIGVYDWKTLTPPIRYTTVKPDGIRFVPLEMDEELTPREILERHPKGGEFGHLISEFPEYPLMIDSGDNVLSIPPIINSALTGKVTENTRDVFIEITGHEVGRISVALNVLVASLSDRGGTLGSVEVVYHDGSIVTPDFTPDKITLGVDECRRILGLEITGAEMVELLGRARYNAVIMDNGIKAEYPAYRRDVMHPRDVMEDIAIAYDLNKMKPVPPQISTIGRVDEGEEFAELVRELMMGLGFQEVLTFSLTNKENLFARMSLKGEDVCEIANPVSSNWTVLRNWLLPSLMEFFASNLHVEYPQRIYEVGDVLALDQKAETRARNVKRLACAITNSTVSYEDTASVLDSLLRNLGMEYRLVRAKHGSFIEGRAAEVSIKGKRAGVIGEIHPMVLTAWGLEKPVVAFELALDALKR
ncbi:MAG: phenylalanine--tRNA ligase subunit beta [Candidatus Hydrothermarchaeaceae archaeon]